MDSEDQYHFLRKKMVDDQLISRGISDPLVLNAMMKVKREEFVPVISKHLSYMDSPLDISKGQTISQPYIVAFMTECLELKGGEKVLEIGTGSGYQTAVLAEIVKEVYSVEIIKQFSQKAKKIFDNLGYNNIFLNVGNGYYGLEDKAPFDAIIVTAYSKKVPPSLIEQLKIDGKLVIPIEEGIGLFSEQVLKVITKTKDSIIETNTIGVRFVPLTNSYNAAPEEQGDQQ
ncbi:MAG: protein-L-isoaspartate(D-aspartate) O-methyltransferase [Oligoflexia bacterium]|nr:protein-L-isoaspartate(D-aspartate) O-methyltransferase [Oligoflexia bacterium]